MEEEQRGTQGSRNNRTEGEKVRRHEELRCWSLLTLLPNYTGISYGR